MNPSRLRGLAGIIPALPTPFGADGQVSVAELESLCDRAIVNGASALLVCGVTGEAPTLRNEERNLVIRTAAKIASGRAIVIAGTGSNSTARAIELANRAARAGADASLSVVPYYSRPTQRGIARHFETIAGETSLPTLIHDDPSRTACRLADETLIDLAAIPQVVGLVDATGDPARIARLRRSVGDGFLLLSGDDSTAHVFLEQGGDGVVSALANLAPALCRRLYLACREGRVEKARELSAICAPLIEALSRESDPAPLKCALGLLGWSRPTIRLPLVEVTDETRLELAAVLALMPGEDAAG